MSEAEKKAASLPPKLTVPMILFFLPVLFANYHTRNHSDFKPLTRVKLSPLGDLASITLNSCDLAMVVQRLIST